MTLLDAYQPERSKKPYYIIIAVLVVFLIALLIWSAVRFNPEKKVASDFFTAISAGNLQQAYKIWQPASDYSFNDFLQDWGPKGFYGPVKSFEIESAEAPPKSDNEVAVRVLVSAVVPFPKDDATRESKTRSLVIWVNRVNHSLSSPPPAY